MTDKPKFVADEEREVKQAAADILYEYLIGDLERTDQAIEDLRQAGALRQPELEYQAIVQARAAALREAAMAMSDNMAAEARGWLLDYANAIEGYYEGG